MLTNTVISGNTGNGIDLHAECDTSMPLTIANDTVSDNGGWGLHTSSWWASGSPVTVQGSTFAGNAGGGIYFQDSGRSLSILGNVIEQNGTAAGAGNALTIETDSGADVESNLVVSNTSSSSDLWLTADSGTTTFADNTVVNNTAGGSQVAMAQRPWTFPARRSAWSTTTS